MTHEAPRSEAGIIDELIDINRKLIPNNTAPGERTQHGKGVADIKATFTVLDEVYEQLRVGLFERPGTYEALVRFSNGSQHNDSRPDSHGMAVKVFGVPMETAPISTDGISFQDFIMIDTPVFVMGNLENYIPFNFFFLNSERSLWGKVRFGLYLLPRLDLALRIIRLFHFPSAPLSTNYWSTTPYALGEQAVKYMAQCSATALPSPTISGRNGRREALTKQLESGPGSFTFGVHLQNDSKRQPIDDPTVNWEEQGAVFHPLARIDIAKDQNAEAPPDIESELAFSPGHASREHRPLGAINRARVAIYAAMAERRQALATHDDRVGCPLGHHTFSS